ncbi:hypothetical protein [Nocardioides flavescens]|uniref:Uncharacterized protein n=1 Tax=Nocardioides flavescens TaxID=2691959 RepID=A0A6L7EQY3_9ACTN|nr:hypothetical protein [Nocardioides flavescens]MXG89050.1 hypothetical protein [Nocardioides flavescens]
MSRTGWMVAGLGAVLVLGGVVGLVIAPPAQTDFGWFAYTPLGGPPRYAPSSLVLLSAGQVVAAAAVVAGLLVLAALAGYAAGRRRQM